MKLTQQLNSERRKRKRLEKDRPNRTKEKTPEVSLRVVRVSAVEAISFDMHQEEKETRRPLSRSSETMSIVSRLRPRVRQRERLAR